MAEFIVNAVRVGVVAFVVAVLIVVSGRLIGNLMG